MGLVSSGDDFIIFQYCFSLSFFFLVVFSIILLYSVESRNIVKEGLSHKTGALCLVYCFFLSFWSYTYIYTYYTLDVLCIIRTTRGGTRQGGEGGGGRKQGKYPYQGGWYSLAAGKEGECISLAWLGWVGRGFILMYYTLSLVGMKRDGESLW